MYLRQKSWKSQKLKPCCRRNQLFLVLGLQLSTKINSVTAKKLSCKTVVLQKLMDAAAAKVGDGCHFLLKCPSQTPSSGTEPQRLLRLRSLSSRPHPPLRPLVLQLLLLVPLGSRNGERTGIGCASHYDYHGVQQYAPEPAKRCPQKRWCLHLTCNRTP